MRCLMIYLIWSLPVTAFSQSFTQNKGAAVRIPASETGSISSISGYLNQHLHSDIDKTAAAYYWVIQNLRYSTDSAYAINWNAMNYARASEALRRRQGVCINYAALFTTLLQEMNIQAYTVEGICRQYNSVSRSGHGWAVVKLDGKWYGCDPTWDKDAGYNPRYFLVEPSDFIQSHLPFDDIWQLLPYRVTEKDFNAGNFYYKTQTDVIAFEEKLNTWLTLPAFEQLSQSKMRVSAENHNHPLFEIYQRVLQMEMTGEAEDLDEGWYAEAVTAYNNAASFFNDYAALVNSGTGNNRKGNMQQDFLTHAKLNVQLADKAISNIGLKKYNPSCDPAVLKEKLIVLRSKIDSQVLTLP